MLSVPQIDLALKVLIERQMGKWVVVIYLMKCKFSISIGWLNLFLSSENWYRVFCKCFNVELVQIDLAMLLAFVSVFNTGRYVVKSLVRNWMEIIFVQKNNKNTYYIYLSNCLVPIAFQCDLWLNSVPIAKHHSSRIESGSNSTFIPPECIIPLEREPGVGPCSQPQDY